MRQAGKKRIAFPFKQQFLRQPHDFVAVFGKPMFEKCSFALSLRISKIAADEFRFHHQARIRSENHIGQARL